jgi:glycosyltransferase involved in cell wall biosynthesis
MTPENNGTIVHSNVMRLTFAAHGIHRSGGMEKAACEVLHRMSNSGWDISVIANRCDLEGVHFERVALPKRPAVLACMLFELKAQRLLTSRDLGLTASIGAAAGPVHVVTAQFCHAAFSAKVAPSRGRGYLGREIQKMVQTKFCYDERRVYRHSKLRRVIAVSKGTASEIAEFYGVNPAIIRVVPNGVDTNCFRPASGDERTQLRARLNLPSDLMLGCFVGGDWGRKGLSDAIEALPFASDTGLIVVGRGDETHYRELAKNCDVANRVWFVGSTRQPQEYLRACDVYVFPSRYEAFSLSCIEAAACGLPLVVTAINGVTELVEDGIDGYFVEPQAQAIGARLVMLRDDQSLRVRMSNAIAAKGAMHDWDTIAIEYAKAYAAIN